MEIEERLNALLSQCAWIKDASTALRIAPSLAVDLPPLVELTGGGVCLPVACADDLLGAVAEVLAQVGVAGLTVREPIHQADHDALMADPLVPRLAGLMAETVRPGFRTQAVPALVTAWACTRLLGAAPWRGGREREIQELRSALGDLPPAERGAALANLSWSISGRIGAAGALARQAGWAVRVAGLSRALLSCPLLLSCPPGSLSTSEDLVLAAALLGIDIDASLVDALMRASAVAVAAAMSRLKAGKSRPVDQELAALLDGAEPDGALFVLGLGVRLPLMLPELVDAAELTGAGISKASARALLKPATARALSSAWGELQSGLLRWDLLSALCGVISPINLSGGQWRADSGSLPAGPWELLSPRYTRRPEERTVVAVNLSRLRAAAREVAAARKLPVLSGIIERQWRAVAAGAPTSVLNGDFGVAIFSEPMKALDFALRTHKTLSSLSELDIAPLGRPIRLLSGTSCSVGISHGQVLGGFDGAHTSLEGDTITRAVALCGSAAADGAPDDALGVRGAYLGAEGFHSSSVVLGRRAMSTVGAVLSSRRAAHVRGKSGSAAGVSEDFTAYPVQAWWEAPEGARLLLNLTASEGVAELLTLTTSELVDFHASDAMLARSRAPSVGGVSQTSAAPSADPFADDFEPATDSFQVQPPAADEPEHDFSADPFAEPAELEEPEDAAGFDFPDDSEETEALSSDPFRSDEPDFFSGSAPPPSIIVPTLPPPPSIIVPTLPPPSLVEPEEDDDSDFMTGDPSDPESFDMFSDFESDDDLSEESPPESAVPAPPMLFDDDEDDEVPLFASPPMMLDEEEPDADADFIGEGSVAYESGPEEFFMLEEDDEDEVIAIGFDEDDEEEYEEEYELDVEPDSSGPASSRSYGEPELSASTEEPSPPMFFEDDAEEAFDDLSFDDEVEFTIEDTGEEDASTPEGPAVVTIEDDEPSEEYAFEMDSPAAGDEMMRDEDDAGFDFTMPTESPATTLEGVLDDGFSVVIDDELDDTEAGEATTSAADSAAQSGDAAHSAELGEAAEADAEPGASEAEGDVLSAAFMATDIPKIFHRYVVAEIDGDFTFGRVDGYVLVDAHQYAADDLEKAYLKFLSDKMREGFMMQIHMTHDLAGLDTSPVELRYLEKAYLVLMGT